MSVRLRQSSALGSPHNKSLAPAALHTGHSVLITPTLSLRQERERAVSSARLLLSSLSGGRNVEMEAAPGQGPATHI